MTVPATTGRPAPQASPVGEERGLDGVGFLLGVAHRIRRRRWEERLADLGLTAPQAAVLRLVSVQPGGGVRHLARQLGTDPMSVQRTIETLAAKGLCFSGHDPADARRRPVYPTPSGRRLARRVTKRAQESEQAIIELLGESTYQALLEGLRALSEGDAGPVAAEPAPGPATTQRDPRRATAQAVPGGFR